MGIFTSLKRAFNISGAQVTVSLDDEVYSQNDRVSGLVVITGRELDQSGNSIKLKLMEFWTETRYNSTTKSSTTVTKYHTHDTLTLANTFTIKPNSEQSFRFETQLPLNARFSTRSTGWRIHISLDIPSAVDPKEFVTLDVQPAEEFQAVIEACETSMRFEESMRHRTWVRKSGKTRLRMIPPDVLKKELDYLGLLLRQTGDGGVAAELLFDLQEKSTGDYFKAMFNQDKVKVALTLTNEQLFLPEGGTNVKAITDVIGPAMVQVVENHQK